MRSFFLSVVAIGLTGDVLAGEAKTAGSTALGSGVAVVRERLDRGLVAVRTGPGKVYLGWRLLAEDAGDIAFDVYQKTGGGAEKINREPIAKTTDILDAAAPAGDVRYFVRSVGGGEAEESSRHTPCAVRSAGQERSGQQTNAADGTRSVPDAGPDLPAGRGLRGDGILPGADDELRPRDGKEVRAAKPQVSLECGAGTMLA